MVLAMLYYGINIVLVGYTHKCKIIQMLVSSEKVQTNKYLFQQKIRDYLPILGGDFKVI